MNCRHRSLGFCTAYFNNIRNGFFFKSYYGIGWDGLAAKMPSVQAWQSKEDPWGLQKAGSRESTPQDCRLISTCIVAIHTQVYRHTQTNLFSNLNYMNCFIRWMAGVIFTASSSYKGDGILRNIQPSNRSQLVHVSKCYQEKPVYITLILKPDQILYLKAFPWGHFDILISQWPSWDYHTETFSLFNVNEWLDINRSTLYLWQLNVIHNPYWMLLVLKLNPQSRHVIPGLSLREREF